MAKQSNTDKYILDFRDSVIREIEFEIRQSEQRMRFFLGFVTGVGGFIGVLDKINQTNIDPITVSLFVLPVLIFYGILTFSQIIWSSHVKYNLDKMKGYLTNLLDHAKVDIGLSDDSNIFILKNIKGTFAQYMYLTEGLLVAVFIFLLGFKHYPNSLLTITILTIVAFVITVVLMILWSNTVKYGKTQFRLTRRSS